MATADYAVDEKGERYIPATRRPDGTWRKERRVREGYVPQDEQPVYQPRGALRAAKSKCPGYYSDEDKKPAGRGRGRGAASTRAGGSSRVAGVTAGMQRMSVGGAAGGARAGGAAAAPKAAPLTGEAGKAAVLQKLILKSRKKLRECAALQARKEAGEKLNSGEEEKLGKMPGWEAEVAGLEAELAALQPPTAGDGPAAQG